MPSFSLSPLLPYFSQMWKGQRAEVGGLVLVVLVSMFLVLLVGTHADLGGI